MEILGQSTQIIAQILSNPLFWVLLVLAVILGGPIGMIPGIGGITLVAIALPFVTMNLDPVMGMLFIVGILALGNTLDAVPAVLLGYPTAATQVTFFEGHQLAQKGQGGRTLGAV